MKKPGTSPGFLLSIVYERLAQHTAHDATDEPAGTSRIGAATAALLTLRLLLLLAATTTAGAATRFFLVA